MANLSFDFTGRPVIVTGAGQGIGKEIGARLSRAGAEVFLVDLDGEVLRGAADELGAHGLHGRHGPTTRPMARQEVAPGVAAKIFSINVHRRAGVAQEGARRLAGRPAGGATKPSGGGV